MFLLRRIDHRSMCTSAIMALNPTCHKRYHIFNRRWLNWSLLDKLMQRR